MGDSGPVAKRSHRKSRAGCKNCKARKVKCDERRPLCSNCEKHYLNITACEWGDNVLSQRGRQASRTAINLNTATTNPDESETRIRGRISAPVQLEDIGADLLDPFETHPPTEVKGVDRLMNYYITQRAYRSFPFFNTPSVFRAWWPFARDDIVLFHVILQLSAWELVKKGAKADVEKLKRLMSVSVSLLKERLEDPVLSASNETIAAVAHLAAIESERGDTKAFQFHISGLRNLVSIRGSLENVRDSSPLVANTVYWTALVTANDPFTLPPELTFNVSGETPQWLRATAEPIRFDYADALQNDRLGSFMEDVDVLSQRFSIAVHSTSTDDNMDVISAVSLTVQHLLDQAANVPNSPTSISCCVAGALHLISPLGGYYPDSTFTVNALLYKLKSTLASVLDDDHVQPMLKLWLLYVGGVSAIYMPERDWFVRNIVPIAIELEANTWTDARPSLTFIMSHAVFCEQAFTDLWDDVSNKRKKLLMQDFS